jgi:hypothetical protein
MFEPCYFPMVPVTNIRFQVLVLLSLVALRVRPRMQLLPQVLWQLGPAMDLYRVLVVLRVSNRLPKVDNSKLLRASNRLLKLDSNRLPLHSKPLRDNNRLPQHSRPQRPLCRPPKASKIQPKHKPKPQHSKLLRLPSKASKRRQATRPSSNKARL